MRHWLSRFKKQQNLKAIARKREKTVVWGGLCLHGSPGGMATQVVVCGVTWADAHSGRAGKLGFAHTADGYFLPRGARLVLSLFLSISPKVPFKCSLAGQSLRCLYWNLHLFYLFFAWSLADYKGVLCSLLFPFRLWESPNLPEWTSTCAIVASVTTVDLIPCTLYTICFFNFERIVLVLIV